MSLIVSVLCIKEAAYAHLIADDAMLTMLCGAPVTNGHIQGFLVSTDANPNVCTDRGGW